MMWVVPAAERWSPDLRRFGLEPVGDHCPGWGQMRGRKGWVDNAVCLACKGLTGARGTSGMGIWALGIRSYPRSTVWPGEAWWDVCGGGGRESCCLKVLLRWRQSSPPGREHPEVPGGAVEWVHPCRFPAPGFGRGRRGGGGDGVGWRDVASGLRCLGSPAWSSWAVLVRTGM